MKKIISISILFLFAFQLQGQERKSPKKIKVNGDYVHSETKTNFPEIFDVYKRIDVYSFDKQDENIGVTYENETSDKKTTISIYIYPTNEATEDRLRNEYFNSMQSIANFSKNGINATQKLIRKVGDKYICNGIKAEMKNDKNEITQLSLFECGNWFYKIRLTTNELDTNQVENVEKKIVEKFEPTRLTGTKLLNTKATIIFAKAVMRDSTMLGSVMGGALKKLAWANENIKENERLSGFPDLYLEMQIESIKEIVAFETKHKFKTLDSTREYLDQYNEIINAGFLAEYLMEKNNMLMIVPENIKLNFTAYEEWKKNHPIKPILDEKFSLVTYKT
ncbi:hypothetical protein C8C85_0801 [Flavobacterium sp. 103]|uniref:hypothetical protein n=1 Tax=Flavobacterium sp. 103 TaxID=2135624 RepID=UPI000D5EACD6|nr:hypothetical protein [Flavobacterium sp. 103]PVX45038.1 hypothetical protein C8C85_0801 [Flavobacterium sp. 103]